MILNPHELALCVAALDNAEKALREGLAAAARLGMSMPEGTDVTADEMVALKDRIMKSASLVGDLTILQHRERLLRVRNEQR